MKKSRRYKARFKGSEGKTSIGKNQHKPKPRKLTIVCPHCGFKFIYHFTNINNSSWHAELSEISCKRCGKRRI